MKGTIDLQTPLPDLNNSIAIQGPGTSSLAVMRDSAFLFTSAILTVDAGQTASLSGLTLANGNNLSATFSNGGGRGIANFGVLTVSGCTLAGNNATGFDFGGIPFPGRGGAIDNGGTLTIRDSLFICNSAELGGAIYNNASYGMLDVRGSTLRDNSASDSGGAIYNNAGTATVQESTLSCNTAGSNDRRSEPPDRPTVRRGW